MATAGKVLTVRGGIPVWRTANILDEFDDLWTSRYATRCLHKVPSYGKIYVLYEFLWKLKVYK